ncbi:MAG: penicillin-binding protein 2 [Patescibacteria group bacterium]|nr:penicillin-binding protein 2 [Patescibacteria group bacterium]MDD4610786.1 penicillin-binding protein 2 [Patescibacteria group bacterium]
MTNFSNKNNNPFSIKIDKHGKLDGFSYRLGWTEDSYIVDTGKRETVGITFNFSRLKWLIIAICCLLSLLIARAAWLQIVNGSYYYSMAEGNRIRLERVEAKRGIIYDRNFNPLVKNAANFLLYFIPADLPKEEASKNKIIFQIGSILEDENISQKAKEELAKIKFGSLESYQPLFIADNIKYEKAMLLYLESAQMPGVVLSNKMRRDYNLTCSSLSHVLGYTGKISEEELKNFGDEYLLIDYIGKIGLEYFYENELKGKNGNKQIEVDAFGKEKKILSTSEPQDGHNLLLSLDLNLQKKAEEITAEYLKKTGTNKASVIIMDPNNGEILSLVSLPAFDNNVFARGIKQNEYQELINNEYHPLYNRSISGEYPPGSTFKPIMAVAALEEKIINESTSFLSVGGLRINQWFFPDWKSGGHGVTDVRKAIAQSVNTFFYYIGGGFDNFVGLGADRIVNYAKMFGLGAQTGIDLSGEASGFLPSKEWKEETKGERWYIGDTYHLSIGQGDLLATPLQIANYTSVFANGGKLYRPHLVKQILNGKDEIIQNIDISPVRENFIEEKNIEIVKEGMRQTVTSGSAQSLQSVPVAVAGKTGTAQWSSTKPNHAWFTGFAPYDNPQVAITVLVEEGIEGSSVSVPIAKDILTWYFSGKQNESSENKTE